MARSLNCGQPTFGLQVRGITRNADSDAAKKLAAKGVEVVVADMDKPETLKDAFAGVWHASCQAHKHRISSDKCVWDTSRASACMRGRQGQSKSFHQN